MVKTLPLAWLLLVLSALAALACLGVAAWGLYNWVSPIWVVLDGSLFLVNLGLVLWNWRTVQHLQASQRGLRSRQLSS